jgi:hypothetical protein
MALENKEIEGILNIFIDAADVALKNNQFDVEKRIYHLQIDMTEDALDYIVKLFELPNK